MANSVVVTLENPTKTPLIFEEAKLLPITSMQLVFSQSGSIANGDKAGLARVVAKLLQEGTKKKGSAKFALELESRAIQLSSHAGSETFVIELSCLKEEFDVGVAAIIELLQDPNFTQKELDKIKKTLIGSLMRDESNFDTVASRELKKVLFDKTPLAPYATVKSIESITLDDVKKFFKRQLIVEHLIGVVGGDIEVAHAKDALKRIAKTLPNGKAQPLTRYEVRKSPHTKTLKKPTQQAYIYFGSPYDVKSSDEDAYISRVAMFILGAGGFGTRLMEEIRVKRGLAYSAYARASINNTHSYMSGHLQTKLESADEALAIVKSELARFVKEGVTQEELDSARRFLLGSEPLRTETLSQRLSRTFDTYYKGLPLDANARELAAIEALTLDKLNAFIQKHSEILDLSVVSVVK
ncbi:MAG: peptidase M16 [Sulfuricurvum sp. PC08-66]|nr:MAG: peptidase M16 [Sulfuricurvum sp. PC08-66]